MGLEGGNPGIEHHSFVKEPVDRERSRFFYFSKQFSFADMSSELSQYLPGTAGLVDQLDKRLLLVLHDGRHLIGTLRTFDQYLNLVLEDTIERVIFEGRWPI